MNSTKWEQVEDIFHRAAALDQKARETYLSQACGTNLALRAEVDSLLSSLENESRFLEAPAFDLAMKILEDRMSVSLAGQEIGSYVILEKLGSGGMGDVYLAEDVRFKRKVALKFLSESLVDDARAKRQLFREAHAVSLIDHPNICTVFDVKEIGEYSFIVMQYIEGRTLADLIGCRLVEETQLVDIARQTTEALSAAHERGIIHRDIKAGNIMVTPNGQVKVLDFGLAKIVSKQNTDPNAVAPSLITQTNAIAGTIAYMSPEQLRGEKLDFRSDIFSLGTLFYELFSGKHPFLRASDAETISAILNEQFKPLTGNNKGNLQIFNRIVKKCLEKECEKRYPSADDLLREFDQTKNKKTILPLSPLFSRTLAALLILLVITVIGAFVYRRAVAPRSLAVLPFSNLSADANNDFMSGIAETLIQKLSASSNINVRPFTQVANYKLNEVNPLEVGRNLNVDAVLTGKIIEQNKQLILQTSLINTADGSQLWSEDNALNESDTLIVQNKISEKVVSKLQSSLDTGKKLSRKSGSTDNPEAYKYYLQGLNYWKQRDQTNIKKAIDSFNQAASIDPDYALAYSGLAYAYIVRSLVNYRAMPPTEAITIAQSQSEKAIALDENLGEPHAALGAIFQKYQWRWAAAEKEYLRAIELNSNVAQTYYWYSDMLAVTSRFDEASAISLKAQELDPFSPTMEMNVGRVLYYARRFDQAEKYLSEAIKKNPNNNGAKAILALVYIQQPSEEKQSAAVKLLEELYNSDAKSYAATLGYIYAKTGKRAAAEKILDDFRQLEISEEYVPAHEKVMIYLGLGDRENALAGLEKAYQEHFLGLGALNVDPVYDDLRTDERLKNLLVKMNLNYKF